MNPQQQQQLYALFVGVFVLNVAVTIWNIKEGHVLRELQRELAEKQLEEVKKRDQFKNK